MTSPLDETVDALDEVVDECRRSGSRAGYFPAMYGGVTRTVRARVAAYEFADGDRMARFVHAFADRYLVAYRAWRHSGHVPDAWAIAFDATDAWRPIVLQHLLLGINAHINFDLGLVAADLAGSPDVLADLRGDFDGINDVLGDLVDPMQEAVGRVSPWLGLLDRIGARSDEAIVNFSLGVARKQAWTVAERMVAFEGSAYEAAVSELDSDVASIGERVRRPGIATSTALLAVRLRETATPATVIDELARSVSP